MSELHPIIPAQEDGTPVTADPPPEPAPITEEEVGDYREQDRFLPVRPHQSFIAAIHCVQSR